VENTGSWLCAELEAVSFGAASASEEGIEDGGGSILGEGAAGADLRGRMPAVRLEEEPLPGTRDRWLLKFAGL
jgi:hypothetical protein